MRTHRTTASHLQQLEDSMKNSQSDLRQRLGGARSTACAPRSRIRPIAIALTTALLGMAVAASPVLAQTRNGPSRAEQASRPISVPAGSLRDALDALASTSGITILYSPELVSGKTTRGVSGRYAPAEALRLLLQDSGLEAQEAGDATFTLRRTPASAAPRSPASSVPATAQAREPEVTDMGTMTITGTRIRGGSTPSPVITIGAEQIAEEGFSDLGEVIRSVPQNFSGGQNPGVLSLNIAGAGRANNNLTGGASLNLRGLGPDASLALMNGRRMSYGGFVQAVDISAIPVEAVERIEIVADGASAIYGSDAVGGVANVILKREFDGFALSGRYGTATDGGLTTREYTATAGTTWTTGGLIATYKDVSTDPIYARQRHYTEHLTHPTTIYPGSDLRSGLVSAHHLLGNVAELRLDAFRTERKQNYNIFHTNGMNNQARSDTTISLAAPSVEFFLPNDWTLSIGGAWAKDEHLQVQSWENIETTVASLWLNECYCNESRMYEVGAEGPLFDLPGGEARLAVGAGARSNEFRQFNFLTGLPIVQGDDGSRFGYAEINLPLVGADQSIPGFRRLQLTGALRGEDYDSFGGVTTPKVGVIYGPTIDFTLKATWGKAFKAPTLFERNNALTTYLYRPQSVGGTGYPPEATVLYVDGGNPGLQPERARTWSVSLSFHPDAVPNLQTELTWFDIDYTDRVIQPIGSAAQAMSNPIYADFRSIDPAAEEQAAAIAASSRFSNNLGVPYDPGNVVAIIYGQYVNVAWQQVRGVDLSGSYWADVGAGRITVRGSASWLDSSQTISVAQGTYDLAGTLHNPAKLNGRLGIVWSQGGLSVSTFGNYAGGVTNMADGREAASFTTIDAVMRFSTGERGGPWSGMVFAISAENLFDRSPPLYTPARPAYVAPYDATNYSAIGRFISFNLSKHW